MKNITIRKRFLLVVLVLFGFVTIHATGEDLIAEQLCITLDKAGTLPYKIVSSQKYLITNLKVIGDINGTDIRFIRDMAGRNYLGESTEGKLATLDLSESKIIDGGDCYYTSTYGASLFCRANEIGDYIFEDCGSLTNITVPSSVTSIGSSAFGGCSNLTNISIPSSVTSIGDAAFMNCVSLTNISIPLSVIEIGHGCFNGCSSLTEISIPMGVTSIKSSTFGGCSNLTNISIPSSVTSIEDAAFMNCVSLTNISIPSNVTSIGRQAFERCRNLTNVNIPFGVTTIGSCCFLDCSSLTNISIPTSVTSIDDIAFDGCHSLTSIAIPSSVISIGVAVFECCYGFQKIYVSWNTPMSINKIEDVFYGVNTKECILYVPQGTYNAYKASAWKLFSNIVEYDVAGIKNKSTVSDTKEISRHSADGQQLYSPIKGLNIVKYSDGSLKKIIVK